MPKPDADLCMCIDLLLDKNILEIRAEPPGLRTSGLMGHRAIVGCGPAIIKTFWGYQEVFHEVLLRLFPSIALRIPTAHKFTCD